MEQQTDRRRLMNLQMLSPSGRGLKPSLGKDCKSAFADWELSPRRRTYSCHAGAIHCPTGRAKALFLLRAATLILWFLFVCGVGRAAAQAAEGELLKNGTFEGGSGSDGRGGGVP